MEKLVIDKMFAFVVENPEGEGVVGINTQDGWIPLVGANTERVESYKPIAQEIADRMKKEIKIIFFSERTEIDIIKPRD